MTTSRVNDRDRERKEQRMKMNNIKIRRLCLSHLSTGPDAHINDIRARAPLTIPPLLLLLLLMAP